MANKRVNVDLPRRCTVGDKFFMENPELMQGLMILLDGEQQHGVVSYDMDEGYVEKHALDALGRPRLTPNKQDLLTEKVYGEVSFDHVTNHPQSG
jgi:hypothetical protein